MLLSSLASSLSSSSLRGAAAAARACVRVVWCPRFDVYVTCVFLGGWVFLARVQIGEFEYNDALKIAPLWSTVFWFLYIFLMTLVVMNMLLAIIIEVH